MSGNRKFSWGGDGFYMLRRGDVVQVKFDWVNPESFPLKLDGATGLICGVSWELDGCYWAGKETPMDLVGTRIDGWPPKLMETESRPSHGSSMDDLKSRIPACYRHTFERVMKERGLL